MGSRDLYDVEPPRHCGLPQPCRCCTFHRNDTIQVTAEDERWAEEEGARRQSHHSDNDEHAERCNPNDPNREHILGLLGERIFSKFTGGRAKVDTSIRPGGDGGVDFRFGAVVFNFKLAQKWPTHGLFVKVGKVKSDIYILGWYDKPNRKVVILGATLKQTVLGRPKVPPRHQNLVGKFLNHEVPLDDLRKGVDWLAAVIWENLEKV